MRGNIADLLEPAARECRRLSQKQANGEPLTPDERAFAESMRDGAENTLEPLLCGLEALGELMTLTHSSDEVMPKQTVSGLGWLLVTVCGAIDGTWRIHGETERILSPAS